MCTDHVNTTPTLSITVYIISILFFLFFFLIFWLHLHYLPYLEMCTDHVNSTPILSTIVYIMSVLFFSFFPDFLAIFTLITILGNAHRPCKQLSNITTPSLFFSWFFFLCFFHLNYKIYHIWQYLVFIPVTGFQCHSVLVNSGDCSGEITGISKFRGRSEILAGKFHWNGTEICWNDQNPAGICGASLRPHKCPPAPLTATTTQCHPRTPTTTTIDKRRPAPLHCWRAPTHTIMRAPCSTPFAWQRHHHPRAPTCMTTSVPRSTMSAHYHHDQWWVCTRSTHVKPHFRIF